MTLRQLSPRLRPNSQWTTAFLMLLPAFLVLGVFTFYPIILFRGI
ncbi:MAG: hypothetical protein U0452_09810 [Anaerolineae bacterium]